MAGQYERSILLDQAIVLDAGHEWFSDPFHLLEHDLVDVTATANENFYAGFFPREEFVKRYGRGGEPFFFRYGSDRAAYTTRLVVDEEDEFYFVLRVGVFSGKARIHARILLRRPVEKEQRHDG
ncbi:MAG: hypothetical protein M1126_06880 [Candidatus Thermoplasmatota archaeon]|nr:hypothetical protein [Candidatus Thermoplasmatota archaeon]